MLRTFYRYILKLTKRALVITLIASIVLPGMAQAVLENKESLPRDPVLKDMYDNLSTTADPYMGGWGQTTGGTGSDRPCGYAAKKYNNAQWTWISARGNNNIQIIDVDVDSNGQVSDSVNLQLNATAAHCDSIIDDNTGRITNTTLKDTHTRIISAQAKYLDTTNPGQPTERVFGSTSGLVGGVVSLNYGFTHNDGSGNQRRFVKYQGSVPFYRHFTLSGIQSLNLQPRPEPYYINLYTTERPVNRFVYADGREEYKCVDGDFVLDEGYDDEDCGPTASNLAAQIRIRINVTTSGTCSFLIPLQTTADAKTTIPVRIRATNTGSTTWNQSSYYLKALDENQLLETGGANDDGKVYMNKSVAKDGLYDFTFNVKAPPDPTPQAIFKWAMYNGNQRISNVCSADVRVKNNTPYIHASGGDVYSGALFADASGVCAVPSAGNKALKADVKTTGYYDSGNPGNVFKDKGFSGSQYAVFATGQIGFSNEDLAANNFLGSYGYNRPGFSGIKDALFANIGGDGNDYGNFTSGEASGVPCIRTNTLTSGAQLSAGSINNEISSGSGKVQLSGGSTSGNLVVAGRKVVVVNGDLTIGGNIKYNSAGYGNVSSIPNLTVIVRGNIYIESGVDTLDGQYIALPTSTGGGLIDTCSSGSAGVWPSTMTTSSCATKLTVHGSLAANKFLLKRTYGTLGSYYNVSDRTCYYQNKGPEDGEDVADSNGFITDINSAVRRMKACAAESIEFSPESYLGVFKEQTISNVPSSTVELPPVY